MDVQLTVIEARVLGALIEKERTTPAYYPLSLNALTNACNQKSNRDPVMSLSDRQVAEALEQLHDRGLVYQRTVTGARAVKYAQRLLSVSDFTEQEIGVLCVLLLRGPQTPGEIRSRTGRLCTFEGLAEVDATLKNLATREDGPYVKQLPRERGRREQRYAHLFCGEVSVEQHASVPEPLGAPVAATAAVPDEQSTSLAEQIAALRAEVDELKEQFATFKQQFE